MPILVKALWPLKMRVYEHQALIIEEFGRGFRNIEALSRPGGVDTQQIAIVFPDSGRSSSQVKEAIWPAHRRYDQE